MYDFVITMPRFASLLFLATAGTDLTLASELRFYRKQLKRTTISPILPLFLGT
jgi:hypothetical protein